jgi:hypothetical protein
MSHPASSELIVNSESARRGTAGLWFAVFGPAAAWFASLVVSYFAVHEVCRAHSMLGPRVVSLVALIVALAAGVLGRSIWVQNETHARTRFLGQLSVLGGAVFSLIILLQLVATLLIPTCRDRPRSPQAPDVILPAFAPPSRI